MSANNIATATLFALVLTTAGLACNQMNPREGSRTNDEGTSEQKSAEVNKEAPAQQAQAADDTTGDAEQAAELFEDPGAKTPKLITHAVAVIEPTAGNGVMGHVSFESQSDGKLKVEAHMKGLPKGKHAFHVHLYGDCTGDNGKTAGTHFNFSGSSKNPPANIKRITGNLGELEAGADGEAEVSTVLDHGEVTGRYGILGRAVIVHAKGNDPTKPPIGGAGARLGCGVIGIAEESAQKHAAL